MVVVAHLPEWWHMLNKHSVSVKICGPSVLDVVDDCPTYGIGKRKGNGFLRFVLYEGQLLILPIEVAEPEFLYIL